MIENPLKVPCASSQSVSTSEMSASAGASSSNLLAYFARTSSSPPATTSKEPSERFWANPDKPSLSASCLATYLKLTPCTSPKNLHVKRCFIGMRAEGLEPTTYPV